MGIVGDPTVRRQSFLTLHSTGDVSDSKTYVASESRVVSSPGSQIQKRNTPVALLAWSSRPYVPSVFAVCTLQRIHAVRPRSQRTCRHNRPDRAGCSWWCPTRGPLNVQRNAPIRPTAIAVDTRAGVCPNSCVNS